MLLQWCDLVTSSLQRPALPVLAKREADIIVNGSPAGDSVPFQRNTQS